MIDLVNLVLYCIQQLGVMLGVGAETVVLLAYLLAIRDGVVDQEEMQFARAVKKILYIGIVCILISGLPITFLEFASGQGATVFAPAYLFKCLLIVFVLAFAYFLRGSSLPEGLAEGLAGGTWYALFVVHILAPVATWDQLWPLYGVWLFGFAMLWMTLVFALRGSGAGAGQPYAQQFAPPLQPLRAPAPHPHMSMHMPKFLAHTPKAPAPKPQPAPVAAAVPPPPPVQKVDPLINFVPKKEPAPIVAAATPTPAAVKPQQKIEQQPVRLAPIQPAWPQPARAEVAPKQAPVAVAPTPAPEPAPQPQQKDELPRVRVMPKSLADLQKQNRVLFN